MQKYKILEIAVKNINYILFIFLTVMFTACKDSNSKNRAAIDTPNVSPSSHREISLPKGWTISVISPQYKTVQEVVTYEPPVDLVAIPAKFKWVDGEIEGFTVHHPLPPVIMKPPIYETVTETLVVQKAYTTVSIKPETLNTDGSIIENLKVIEEHVPAVTKQVSRRVIKTPAEPFGPAEYAKRIEQMKTPHLIENGRTRIEYALKTNLSF